ncbi:MAG: adenosylcobinamide amidohydrolase [Candidatus Binatia bacterium]
MIIGRMPWAASVYDRTLVVALPALYRVLSWAPLNGGFSLARSILNHQVRTDEYPAEEPAAFLLALGQRYQINTPIVGLMTGVMMARLVRRIVRRDELLLECFATVGLSNALAVGDPATYEEKPGTINLIVVLNQSLTEPALVEATTIVTEAKTQALFAARVKSTMSDALATGTGTDCVAVACPQRASMSRYCGKHTVLGELLGQVVSEAMVEGLHGAGVGKEQQAERAKHKE